ncbi:hypothetical protein D3C84_329680 [compost metagenome]
MAQIFDFQAVDSSEKIIEQLAGVGTDDLYAWVRSIVRQTTDQYVKNNLPPSIDLSKYAPWRIDENIEEAGNLLNNSLERSSEIQALEAEAIRTALDIQFAQQIQKYELEILALEVAANKKQASEYGNLDPELLNERDALISNARNTRLNHHLTSGSSLNFSERVDYLRKLLASNIKILYERLSAIRIGVECSYRVQLQELPKWENSETLSKLVLWLRYATATLDEGRRQESVYEVHFALGAENIADVAVIKNPGTAIIRFKIEPKHFPGLHENDSIRIVALGATLSFADSSASFNAAIVADPAAREVFNSSFAYVSKQRESLSLSFRLDLPKQRANLTDIPIANRSWDLQSIRLSGVPAWFQRSLLESFPLYSELHYANASPIGEWEIEVPALVDSPNGKLPREKAGAGMITEVPALQAYIAPKDIILGIRVAVRVS